MKMTMKCSLKRVIEAGDLSTYQVLSVSFMHSNSNYANKVLQGPVGFLATKSVPKNPMQKIDSSNNEVRNTTMVNHPSYSMQKCQHSFSSRATLVSKSI